MAKGHYAGLEVLSRFIEEGNVTPIIDRTYPLSQVPDAMEHLESGQVRGRIAVTV